MKTLRIKTVCAFNKKGSYILEAAIVLPVIILTVITAVLIIMFFYTQMTEQCRLHTEVRKAASMVTDKTTEKVYDKKYLIMEHKGSLHKRGTFVVEGSCYVTDGPSYIRYSSIIRREKDEQ